MGVKIELRRFTLRLAHRWAIARALGPDGRGGDDEFQVVFVELRDEEGRVGLGEAAPSERYGETVESTVTFLEKVDPGRLSFADLAQSTAYVESVGAGHFAAKCALDIALLDGAARRAGKPIYDYLGLGFTEGKHVTSFSLGIDQPDKMRAKAREAGPYPVLKLKLGGPNDRESLAAVREAAPGKKVRVDANEAWKTREEALRQIEWLAGDGHVEFVEQPMPAKTDPKDLLWLKSRSPLALMADESCQSVHDIPHCAECYHAVNVKLVKAGGITPALHILRSARQMGLRTMIGCMIESSVLISAAAHLAAAAHYLDVDGNLLITNDPYAGVTARQGVLSFAEAPDPIGLRVKAR